MAGYKNSPTGVLKDDRGDVQVNRHWHDLSHGRITSLPFGKVVPIYNKFVQGNTKVKMDNTYAVQTNATLSPVFSKVDITATVVYCPIRLYVYGLYGNNYQEIDEIGDISLPHLDDPYDSAQINHICGVGSILHRLRYPGFYEVDGYIFPLFEDSKSSILSHEVTNPHNSLNAVSILAYYDACRYFYADAYDKNIPFEASVVTAGIQDDIQVQTLTRIEYMVDYDKLVESIYAFRFGREDILIPGVITPDDTLDFPSFPVVFCSRLSTGTKFAPMQLVGNAMQMHDGLFPCTFKPDFFNAWYDSDETEKLVITSTGTIQSIRLAQADFNLKASILVRGKRYNDYNNVLNGGDLSMNDHPIFCGSDYLELGFQDIVSTATTENKPLGTPVARGFGRNFKTPTIEFTTHEPGVLLVLASCVPDVAHRNETLVDHTYLEFKDIPNRFYDGVGFQDLRAGLANFTGTAIDDFAVGSQAFYMEAMVGYDIVDGLLATAGYDSYAFTRRYGLNELEQDDPEIIIDLCYGKYFRTGDYEYIFPAYAPINADGLASAPQLDNIFLYADIDVRFYQPLTNQVITTNSI